MGTFIERSNNVVSERSLWTLIERHRERCGNVALQVFATFLQRSYIERYKLVPKLLSVIVSKHTIDRQSTQG